MPREVVHDPYGRKASGLGVTGEAIHPSEVLERHGTGGNAEVLIAAVREHNPEELVAHGRRKVDLDATKALLRGEFKGWPDVEKAGLSDVGEIAGEGATVLDAKIRSGNVVTYAATDSQGTIFKGAFRLDDPEGSHVSQAELLGRESSVAAPIVGARRAAREAAEAAANAALAAREKALAKRERELMEKEQELERLRVENAEHRADEDDAAGGQDEDDAAGGQDEDDGEGGGDVDRPGVLPDNYDELDAKEAAKVVHALEGEDRQAALEYERATKRRKSVTGDES